LSKDFSIGRDVTAQDHPTVEIDWVIAHQFFGRSGLIMPMSHTSVDDDLLALCIALIDPIV
jgi:hypothetical protein